MSGRPFGARRGPIPTGRLACAGCLLAVYALPLFVPPGPAPLGVVTPAGATLLERILPGVPSWWIAIRLVALAAGVILLLPLPVAFPRIDPREVPSTNDGDEIDSRRILAVGVAVFHAIVARWAGNFGTAGQTAYLMGLFLPALLLASPSRRWRRPRWRAILPVAGLIALWTALRLFTDLNSPRAATMADDWRGWLDVLAFVQGGKNLLTDLYDPYAPGIGATALLFQGLPLYRSGVLPLSFRAVQVFHILWLAVCAAGIGALARRLIGRGTALVAVAVFLFAPVTRMMSIFPLPYVLGPLYATAIGLCSVAFWRRRSEAALAALGALTGLTVLFPPAIAIAGVFDLYTVWHLRRCWRRVWPGAVAAAASLLAVVIPALPTVLRAERATQVHLRWDGLIQLIDPVLLGQLPIQSFSQFRDEIVARPLDIVVGALLAPFAHPRMAVHLLGDSLFDPLGAVLLAIGIAACACRVRRSSTARLLPLLLVAALAPAFISPVNVVDIMHALVLPVAAALLSAAGFVALRLRVGWLRSASARVLATLAICLGGTVLFDVVNVHTLGASSLEIMFRSLNPVDADRVVVVDYPKDFRPEVRTGFYTGPISAFGARRPVGYFAYEPGNFPVSDLAAEGKDLLFWSAGLEEDVRLASAVCAQWPAATLYEIVDAAGVGRSYAANVSGVPWRPALAADRWREWPCRSHDGAP